MRAARWGLCGLRLAAPDCATTTRLARPISEVRLCQDNFKLRLVKGSCPRTKVIAGKQLVGAFPGLGKLVQRACLCNATSPSAVASRGRRDTLPPWNTETLRHAALTPRLLTSLPNPIDHMSPWLSPCLRTSCRTKTDHLHAEMADCAATPSGIRLNWLISSWSYSLTVLLTHGNVNLDISFLIIFTRSGYLRLVGLKSLDLCNS